MSRAWARESRAGVRTCAAAVALALLASGCSMSLLGNSQSQPPPPAEPTASAEPPKEPAKEPAKQSSFRERMTALFSGKPAPSGHAEDAAAAAAAAQRAATEDCPTVDVRSGASTYALGPPGAEPTATTLRFQVTITQTARECTVRSGNMTVKVGIQGRVILGPAGTPGQVEVPIRLALVQEGVEPKTIWTRAYRVPVNVPQGQGSVPFVHIEEDITFPMPKPAELDAYVVYVGFDPALIKEEKKPERKPPAKKPRASG